MELISPAKINLFLRVVGKRADGYHDLASLFQAIDLSDHLFIHPSADDSFSCSDPAVPLGSTNLVNRALALFREKTGHVGRYAIHLEKHIPMQGGLGGGSSNAATTLWGLNAIAGTGISDDVLAAWGAEIGSDVPFFFSSGTAYCTGRGEIVKSLEPCFSGTIYLVKPEDGVCTTATFRALDLGKLPRRDPARALETFERGGTEFFNDLEVPVFEKNPVLSQLKQQLLASGYTNVLMTGSGSAFFCTGSGSCQEIPACFHRVCAPVRRTRGHWYN